ncbi:MAG TPA: ABC transporter ATP-binding protein, partial [Elusimicrobiota bacterium]|nr:ABC transporter ATP-binding protein [Elusimicrobiota bacterium]
DEPTAGVSPEARARFWELIRDVAGAGKTVFVTTHYMDEAEQCGRIALMRAGRIIALDTPAGLKRSAFPEPLLELTPPAAVSPGWADRLRKNTAVALLVPYGMRFHAALRPPADWSALAGDLPKGTTHRRIAPSLEDVFLRLVEGGTG